MDAGQRQTEALVKQMENRIRQEYAQAEREISEKLEDYWRRHELKDQKWKEWVADGKKTQAEYDAWKTQQLAVGRKWEAQKNEIAQELSHARENARAIVNHTTPEIYAGNHNFATYQIEHDARIDTSYTLYNREAVERLMRDNPEVLPPAGKKVSQAIAEGKAVAWDKQKLQSVMIQGILQGDSIPHLAERLARTVGDSDMKASIRNARTMATRAQNAGRVDAYKRAQDKGVELEQMWLATMDNRTRHSHRYLDGETRPLGEAFSNGCEYPADPKGDPAEIYNCRCSLRGVVKGLDRKSGQFRDDSAVGGMSYDEWRDAKPEYRNILSQKEKGEAIRRSYIREYGGLGTGKTRKDTAPAYETVTTRKEAIESLKKTFTDVEGLSKLDEKLLVDSTNRFNELNARYGAVMADSGSYLHTTTRKHAIAYAAGGYRDNEMELALNTHYYKDSSMMYDNEARSQKSFFSMPCDEKQYNIYTITHEYGHLLEARISRLRTNWEELDKSAERIAGVNAPKIKIMNERLRLMKAEEREMAHNIRKEIIDIAKAENNDFDLEKSLSKYGHTNEYEFFAEVFANAHCGKPNDLGNAMKKWLKKEGY